MPGSFSKAFTLVELLIVIVIISILAALTIITFRGIQDRAYNVGVTSGVQQYNQAVQAYQAANGSLPGGNTLSSCLSSGGACGSYSLSGTCSSDMTQAINDYNASLANQAASQFRSDLATFLQSTPPDVSSSPVKFSFGEVEPGCNGYLIQTSPTYMNVCNIWYYDWAEDQTMKNWSTCNEGQPPDGYLILYSVKKPSTCISGDNQTDNTFDSTFYSCVRYGGKITAAH